MSPATETQTLAEGAGSSTMAARLELLLQHSITSEQFEADMVRACRQDPEEIWTLLALLDQHHRLETLPTELFRALKASAERYGLIRREPYLPNFSAKPRTVETPAFTAQRAQPPPPPAAPPSEPASWAPEPSAPAPLPLAVSAAAPSAAAPSATAPSAAAPSAPPPVTAAPAASPPWSAPVHVAVPTDGPPPQTGTPADEPPAFEPVFAEAAAEPAIAARPLQTAPDLMAAELRPAAPLELGTVLVGRYKLEAELESDDRGRNFRALDLQHAGQPPAVCQVALHCMEPAADSFESVLAERRAEFRLAQPLSHPHVLSVREFDQDGVRIYLTMNLMGGESLGAVLTRRRGKALARSAALAIIRDVGAALTYSHDHGVVHGNLQPEHILISPAGELRVRGFGAQRASSCYASCEQLENRAPDPRDDLFALACISYELLHGIHPFNCQSASTARGRAIHPARPIRLSGPQWRALRTGLAWRREGRNLSVERWLKRMPLGSASKRLPTLENLGAMPAPRRSWWRPLFAAAGLAAVAAVAAWLYRTPGALEAAIKRPSARPALAQRAQPSPPLSTPATPPPVARSNPVPSAAVTPPALPELNPAATSALPAAPAVPVHETPSALPQPAPASGHTVPPAAPPASPTPAPAQAQAQAQAVEADKLVAHATAAGAPAAATRIGLSADHFTVPPGDSAAHIIVRRSGGAHGEARFTWWTQNASASADVDFIAWGRRVERIRADQGSVTLLVPIIKDSTRTGARAFEVIIADAGEGPKVVTGITRATVVLSGNGAP